MWRREDASHNASCIMVSRSSSKRPALKTPDWRLRLGTFFNTKSGADLPNASTKAPFLPTSWNEMKGTHFFSPGGFYICHEKTWLWRCPLFELLVLFEVVQVVAEAKCSTICWEDNFAPGSAVASSYPTRDGVSWQDICTRHHQPRFLFKKYSCARQVQWYI